MINEGAANWVRYGELSFNDQTRVRRSIGEMFGDLRSNIDTMPPQEYVACRSFLNSLLYATTRAVL